MKKIMFNDEYGLTEAVLAGCKTMTRRIIKGDFENIKAYHANGAWHFIADTKDGESIELKPAYQVGDVVAVSQRYSDIPMERLTADVDEPFKKYLQKQIIKQSAGYKNKMFVLAKLMPYRIRITKVRFERLGDISDEDCEREGLVPVAYPVYDGDVLKKVVRGYSLYSFKDDIENPWAPDNPAQYIGADRRTAFAVLIMKMYGKKVWNANPWVAVYSFKLIK